MQLGLWVPVYINLPRNPKLLRLAMTLKREPKDTWPMLVKLWLWAIEFSPELGKLEAHGKALTSEEICILMEMPSNPKMLDILNETGWVADGAIYDWPNYAGKVVKHRMEAKERAARVRGENPRPVKPSLPENLPSSKIGLLVDILQRKHCPNAIATLRKWADSWAAKKGFQEAEKILNNMPEGLDIIEIRDKYFGADSDEKDWKEIVKEREEERVRNGR